MQNICYICESVGREAAEEELGRNMKSMERSKIF